MASTHFPPSMPHTKRPTWLVAVLVLIWGTSPYGTQTASSICPAKGPSPEPRIMPTSGRQSPMRSRRTRADSARFSFSTLRWDMAAPSSI